MAPVLARRPRPGHVHAALVEASSVAETGRCSEHKRVAGSFTIDLVNYWRLQAELTCDLLGLDV